jgi:colanic acid/amylovoran biosynthesis protein
MSAASYAIFGGSLWGNRGAEAMISAVVGEIRLRQSGRDFALYSYHPEEDRALLTDPSIRIFDARPVAIAVSCIPQALLVRVLGPLTRRLRTSMPLWNVGGIADSDVVIDVSGISFNDGRVGVSLYNLLSTLPANILGRPVVRLSQAFGPFERPVNRMLARIALRLGDHAVARGAASHALLVEAGLADRTFVAPDLAFLYRDEYCLTETHESDVADAVAWVRTARAAAEVAVVVPSSLVQKRLRADGRDYGAVIASQVRRLIASGRSVILVPNATKHGADSDRNNDFVAIEATLAHLDLTSDEQQRLYAVDFDINTTGIRRIIDEASFTITSRFHAMIAALSLGVPVFVIGWSHKYEEVLAQFDQQRHAVDSKTAADDSAELTRHLERFMQESHDARRRIAEAFVVVREAAAEQIDRVIELQRSAVRR